MMEGGPDFWSQDKCSERRSTVICKFSMQPLFCCLPNSLFRPVLYAPAHCCFFFFPSRVLLICTLFQGLRIHSSFFWRFAQTRTIVDQTIRLSCHCVVLESVTTKKPVPRSQTPPLRMSEFVLGLDG